MAGELVTLQRTLNRLGVEADTDDAADALILLRAVSAEIRFRTNRDFPAVATVYDMNVNAHGEGRFLLPHVPVSDVLSVARAYNDGTTDPIYEPNRALLVDQTNSWTTLLADAVAIGDTNAKVDDIASISVGDHAFIGGDEVVRITSVGTAGIGGTGLEFEPAARFGNALGASITHVHGSVSWFVESPSRGKLLMPSGRHLLRVVWRVSGGVPEDIALAAEKWIGERWDARALKAGQTAYTTGDDSEDYDVSVVGLPSPSVASTLANYWRSDTNNGAI